MMKRLLSKIRHFLNNEEGWTVAETIMVIAIVMILSGTVGVVAFRQVGTAKISKARTTIDTYYSALNSYFLDCQQYPTSEQGLQALWEKPTQEPVPKHWNGPYINKAVSADPWGGEFVYLNPGQNGLPFGIKSLGADKKEGGEKADADITSWE